MGGASRQRRCSDGGGGGDGDGETREKGGAQRGRRASASVIGTVVFCAPPASALLGSGVVANSEIQTTQQQE